MPFYNEDIDTDEQRPAATHLRESAARVDTFLLVTPAYSALGTPAEVRDYLEAFVRQAGADELIVAHHATGEARLRSVALLADAMQPAHA